jgi:hypothetical protein
MTLCTITARPVRYHGLMTDQAELAGPRHAFDRHAGVTARAGAAGVHAQIVRPFGRRRVTRPALAHRLVMPRVAGQAVYAGRSHNRVGMALLAVDCAMRCVLERHRALAASLAG